MVRKVVPASADLSGGGGLVSSGERLFFAGTNPLLQYVSEPWISDGTAAGSHRISDHRLINVIGWPRLAPLGSRQVAFYAHTPAHGYSLWVSDGTAAGTRVLDDPWPGPMPWQTNAAMWPPVVAHGLAYFAPESERYGIELHRFDPGPTATRVGHPCGRAGASLVASDPELGKPWRLASHDAPTGGIGAFLLGAVPPRPFALGQGCFAFVDVQRPHVVLECFASQTPTYRATVNVPHDPSLKGVRLAVQSLFLTPASGVDLGNGIHLRL